MSARDLAAKAAAETQDTSPVSIEATVWKRIAMNTLGGEEEAQQAFKDVLEGAMNDLSANTTNTVGVSSGVFESAAESVNDDLSSGVFE